MVTVNQPTAPGDAYDAVLLAALSEHVFDLEDYDAELAAQQAAENIPQLGKFARAMRAADTAKEDRT